MTNVSDIYKALAVRINYPIQPTYRCMQKIIGYINLLLSLTNTPQATIEVTLSGPPNARVYNSLTGEKIAFLYDGEPCKLNPDGTIHTRHTKAYVIRNAIFNDATNRTPKNFVSNEADVLADDYYLQPLLTSLYLLLSGVQPSEAVMYLNDACTRSIAKVETKQVDVDRIKRRL